MIAQLGHVWKVEKSTERMTSFAGLPLLTELAHRSKLIRELDAVPGIWERQGKYGTSDYVMSLALTLIAGGESLEDTRLLREDGGLQGWLWKDLPAPNSLGDFLRRHGHRTISRLGRVNARQVRRLLARQRHRYLTLDIDSSLVEADKREAQKTYKGFDGYNPLLAWLDEPNVFLSGVFRPGNSSPQSHLRSLVGQCRRLLAQGVKLRLRSDSAGYNTSVMSYCAKHGIEFSITADLDAAVMASIEAIPDEKWQLVVRGEENFLLAETVHVIGSKSRHERLPAFRLIATKKLSGQLELFKNPIKHRAIIAELPETMSALEVLEHHNDRGRMEKAIDELKDGFGLDHLPCGQLMANAAFLQVCLIAYNLVQTFKSVALPKGWEKLEIKNLRFRLLCRAAKLVSHAGYLVTKLRDFAFFGVFEQARWAVLAPELAGACG
ncbi:MAG: IS1380 family transposase [Elusimicrobiota bacterium]